VIYETAKIFNDMGEYYPLLGICLGFQTMNLMEAPTNHVVDTGLNALNMLSKHNFTTPPHETKLWKDLPDRLITALTETELMLENHHDGVWTKTFYANKLENALTKIAVAYDRDGNEYIANVEHKNYPFYGFQFHPEKPNFIFHPNLPVNHSPEAREISQYVANFFVDEAKKNSHTMEWTEVRDRMYANY
jgi:gamma-glutamyl hydrolase